MSTPQIEADCEFPIPEDVHVEKDAEWDGEPTSSASFELPISSDLLFFLSGGYSFGDVELLHSKVVADVVKVVITVKRDEIPKTKVCKVNRGKGTSGIGIFTCESLAKPGPKFTVTAHFPTIAGSGPLRLKSFETVLAHFVYKVGGLSETVYFDSLHLQAAEAAISAESVYAGRANITTAGGSITGSYSVSSSLDLTTSNAPIDVSVTLLLYGAGNETEKESTGSEAVVPNDQTDAPTSVITKGGQFKVKAQTSEGPLTVIFTSAPVDSKLSLQANTSSKPANITLHATYEGEFQLMTSDHKPSVDYDPAAQDPAGRGRKRVVEEKHIGDIVTGTVAWRLPNEPDESSTPDGSASVNSSGSPLVLTLAS